MAKIEISLTLTRSMTIFQCPVSVRSMLQRSAYFSQKDASIDQNIAMTGNMPFAR